MKFVLYMDNKDCKTYDYKVMDAKTLEEAIAEADSKWNDEIYLARIMKKVGKIENVDGIKTEVYEAILCRRSFGWHQNNTEHGESKHIARRFIGKSFDWFDIDTIGTYSF